MKVAVIYNLSNKGVINVFGRQNREQYQAGEIERVVQALRERRHMVETFEGDKFLIQKLEAFMPRVLKGEIPGIVFNLAYGIQGESRYTHIPSLLEMLGVPYVGSGPLAHSIALDKAMTKIVLSRAGLPTPAFQVFSGPNDALDPNLTFPLIVKPKDEAVSFGIKVVQNEAALRKAIATNLHEFGQPALVEAFLPGRELNIGLLGNGDDIALLPVVEIDFKGSEERVQTFETKKVHRFGHLCPADLPDALADEIRHIARAAFSAVECRDCARIDIRLDAEERPYILELNSMPAIHPHGSFFAAASVAGYNYADMINRMVEVAVERYFGKQEQARPARKRNANGDASFQEKVTEHLRGASQKMEERLAELVDCNSYTRNKEGTDKLGWTVRRSLEQLGFGCQVFPQAEIGDILLFQNQSATDRADVLLLCHLDVFALDYDTHRRFMRSGSRLYGAGIAEAKGGLVVIEYALKALRYLRQLNPLNVKILLTTDGALGNKYSASLIQRESAASLRVLSFKHAGAEGELVTRRNGVCLFTALVDSDGTHLTDHVDSGVVASIHEMGHKIRAWNRLTQAEKDELVLVTSFQAEARTGNVLEGARATLLVSFPTEQVGERLVTEVNRIGRRSFVAECRCNLSSEGKSPPFHETDAVSGLHRELAQVAESIGLPLGKSRRFTAGEVNWVHTGAAAIDGLGPVGYETRTEDECIEAHTLVERAVLLALFLRGLNTI